MFVEKEKVEIITGKPTGFLDFMDESVKELMLKGNNEL